MTDFLAQHAEIIITLVKIALLLFIVLTVNAYLTWFERKVVAHMQSRWGPHRVGPHGLLQPSGRRRKISFEGRPDSRGRRQIHLFPRAAHGPHAGADVHSHSALWALTRFTSSAATFFSASST